MYSSNCYFYFNEKHEGNGKIILAEKILAATEDSRLFVDIQKSWAITLYEDVEKQCKG